MKRLKFSIAALAFVLTAGVTFAANHNLQAPNDCSATLGGPLNLDSSSCGNPGDNVCCFLADGTEITRQ